jgi:TRAP-type C4-dicarboxylate transport system permease small subunit
MKKFISFFRDGKFEEILGCVMIAVVIIPVIINIINRSFFSTYSISLEVTALLAYVWIGYGFFGYLYKKDAHVDMKFLVNMMPSKMRVVFDFLRDILILVFSVYMVYWGLKLCSTNLTRYATGTKIPLAIGYASIAFGFFTGAVRSFWSIITRFIKKGGNLK